MTPVSTLDWARLEAAVGRTRQLLVDPAGNPSSLSIACIKTPPGRGTPEGIHTHPVDQFFYVIAGTLTVELAGQVHLAPAGSVVRFPANTPHRNWNAGSEPVLHLSIKALNPEVQP